MWRQIMNYSGQRYISLLSKVWSGASTGGSAKYTEADLVKTLKTKFPNAKEIVVNDVSGGCGAMYEIVIESNEFLGLPTIKQHRLVTETLKEEIKSMHGLRIQTSIPSNSEKT